jgi:hypothetical protein
MVASRGCEVRIGSAFATPIYVSDNKNVARNRGGEISENQSSSGTPNLPVPPNFSEEMDGACTLRYGNPEVDARREDMTHLRLTGPKYSGS